MKRATFIIAAFLFLSSTSHPQASQGAVHFASYELKTSRTIHETAGYVTVPFELVNGVILVQAELNGQTGNFILDTGSPSLILNERQTAGQNVDMLSVSKEYRASVARVRQFQWADIVQSNQEALVLDISHLEKNYKRILKGVIGYEVFAGRKMLIDTRNGKIYMSRSDETPFYQLGHPVASFPLYMEGHLPVLKVGIGNQTYRFGIDSGCSVNLMDQEILDNLPDDAYMVIEHRDIQGFHSGTESRPVIRTNAFQISGLMAQDMEFMVSDLSHIQEEDMEIDGMLGYPFLRDQLFSIDYEQQRLTFWASPVDLAVGYAD